MGLIYKIILFIIFLTLTVSCQKSIYDVWFEKMFSGDIEQIVKAQMRFEKLDVGIRKKYVPELIKKLRNADPEKSDLAEMAFKAFGGLTADPLVKILEDPHEKNEIKKRALTALGCAAIALSNQLPLIKKYLADENEDLVASALYSLFNTELPPEYLPILMGHMKSPNKDIRYNAVLNISNIKPPAIEAVPILKATLKDQDPGVRYIAAVALLEISPNDPAARRHVRKLLHDKDIRIRGQIALNLGIDGLLTPNDLPVLTEILRESDPLESGSVLMAIGALRSKAAPAFEKVFEFSKNKKNPNNRGQMYRALDEISCSDTKLKRQVIELIKNDLADPDEKIRAQAAWHFGLIQRNEDAVETLMQMLKKEKSNEVKAKIAEGLGLTRTSNPDVVSTLINMANEENDTVRSGAINGICALGSSAKSALPVIRAHQKDPDPLIRGMAQRALEKIENAEKNMLTPQSVTAF
jgi:HEAT repeat protein